MQSRRLILNTWMSSARRWWQALSPCIYFLALLALFPGMLLVQFGLELAFGVMQPDPKIKMSSSFFASLGLAWLLATVVVVEFIPLSPKENNANHEAPKLPSKYQAWEEVFPPGRLTVIEMFILQLIIIVLYSLMLDGGIRFRGCLYSYLIYLVGPIVFFIRRGLALTKGELIFLKWAWLPIMTFGIPLFVGVSKGKWPIS
jgi:hypothetical protein